MEPLRYINVPDYYCLMFRRHLTEVTLPGGLVDESKKIYPLVGGVYSTSSKTWTFPSGAKVVLRGLELVDDVYQFKGVQVNEILWDELTGFEESQFEYLFSRIRSTNSIKGRVRCSTNPQSEGWVKDIIKEHWLDDEGYAIPSMSGKVKWMVRVGGERKWYDSKEEAIRLGALDTGLPESDILPTSWTFIRSTLDQNPSLGADYKSKLLSMGQKDQMELLSGCWNFDSSTGVYFKREYLEEVPLFKLPKMKRTVRAWDIAASPVSDFNRNPDWTVGVKMGVCHDGYYYIMDMVRFRESIGEVKKRILATARKDGEGTTIVVPMDPGGHGKHAFQDHVKNLSGFIVRKAKTEKSKLERFMPFSSAAENGIVKIVKADWNHDLYMELERFIGDGKRKDDIVDSISDGHKELHQAKPLPSSLSWNPSLGSQSNVWE